jgi:heat shock protein HtpX
MGWMKRIFLFLALNALVITTISLILRLLNVGPYVSAYGLNYTSLMVFCLVWGMAGAFISLALSRIMAKWMMGVRVIDENSRDSGERLVLQSVHRLARGAGLTTMPQVGVYESPELNAFATGPTRSRSLVAVSTGLLNRMSHEEVEGVLGHEIAHIANGDMVTMTLLQGVVNAFAMFLSRVIAYAITQAMRSDKDERGSNGGLMGFAIQMILQMVFLVLGSILVAWYSRYREFRADAGGARLAGRTSMIRALQRLQSYQGVEDPNAQPALASMKISSKPSSFVALFSTHPPLEQRIERLQKCVL